MTRTHGNIVVLGGRCKKERDAASSKPQRTSNPLGSAGLENDTAELLLERRVLPAPSEVEPLLARLAKLTDQTQRIMEIYEIRGFRGEGGPTTWARLPSTAHPTLFVGFGLSDPFDLDLAMRQARLAGEKFALLPADWCPDARARFPELRTIAYSDRSSIERILAVLAKGQGMAVS